MPDRAPRTDTEALRALEERLERATRAAERLLDDARTQPLDDAGTQPLDDARTPPLADHGVPPRGWQRRSSGDADSPPLGGWIDPDDARLLLSALAELRTRVPPELERRLMMATRELLLALRALIDWCVEHAERRTAPPAEVQDIPIL